MEPRDSGLSQMIHNESRPVTSGTFRVPEVEDESRSSKAVHHEQEQNAEEKQFTIDTKYPRIGPPVILLLLPSPEQMDLLKICISTLGNQRGFNVDF
jgi:hypothetical protein